MYIDAMSFSIQFNISKPSSYISPLQPPDHLAAPMSFSCSASPSSSYHGKTLAQTTPVRLTTHNIFEKDISDISYLLYLTTMRIRRRTPHNPSTKPL